MNKVDRDHVMLPGGSPRIHKIAPTTRPRPTPPRGKESAKPYWELSLRDSPAANWLNSDRLQSNFPRSCTLTILAFSFSSAARISLGVITSFPCVWRLRLRWLLVRTGASDRGRICTLPRRTSEKVKVKVLRKRTGRDREFNTATIALKESHKSTRHRNRRWCTRR